MNFNGMHMIRRCIITALNFFLVLFSTASYAIDNPNYKTKKFLSIDGQEIEEAVIIGPPTPPVGFEKERRPVVPQQINSLAVSLTVPAYDWVYGCSAVAGAMIAAYYDRGSYPNMYTGPTNGGVMPLNNSVWPTWVDVVGTTYPNLPLAASKNGVDGRSTRGSIDDYWISYESAANDPYITNGWTQHSWGDAIGDYMKTGQSVYGNVDSSTTFYNYTSSSNRLTCAAMPGLGISTDGTLGRKAFYEARGYSVTDCFNQKTDNKISGGFSFAQFKAEIDAGHPVMLNLAGHTIVGTGYDSSTNTVYVNDTWDYSTHSMTWGTSYSGMSLESVSIVHLGSTGTYPLSVSKAGSGTGTVTSNPAGISCGATCSSSFTSGASVTLTASATSGSTFAGWSGGGCSGTGTCTVTMNASTSVTATFNATVTNYLLSVARSGTGSGAIISNPAGISCGSTCSASFSSGTLVTLSAAANSNALFTGWSGAGCTGTGTCTVTMNAARSVSANFDLKPNVTPLILTGLAGVAGSEQHFQVQVPAGATDLLVSTSGGTGDADLFVKYGAAPTLSLYDCRSASFTNTETCSFATPSVGTYYIMIRGYGSGSGFSGVTLTVTYRAGGTTYMISVSKAGTGSGTVTSNPSGVSCGVDCQEPFASGSTVTLTATPASGSKFTGWNGGCTGTGTCILSMSAAKSVTATFAKSASITPILMLLLD